MERFFYGSLEFLGACWYFRLLHLLIWIPGECGSWTWAPQIFLAQAVPVPHVLAEDAERTVAIPSVSPTSGNEKITLDKGTFYVFVAVAGGTKVTQIFVNLPWTGFIVLGIIQLLPGEPVLCSMLHSSAIPAASRLPSWLPKIDIQGPVPATCSLLSGQGTVLIPVASLVLTPTVELPDSCWGKNPSNIFCWFFWLTWRGQSEWVQLWLMWDAVQNHSRKWVFYGFI